MELYGKQLILQNITIHYKGGCTVLVLGMKGIYGWLFVIKNLNELAFITASTGKLRASCSQYHWPCPYSPSLGWVHADISAKA